MENYVIDGYPVEKYGYTDPSVHTDYRSLKLFLLAKYGVCYHCGRKVRDHIPADGEIAPNDMATIDHLKPRQYRRKYQVTPKVLSCHLCNKLRNDSIQKGKS